MSWFALQRRAYELVPRWYDRWRVRRARTLRGPSHSAMHSVHARRLYVDVSVISRHDAGTGIQRVVRAIATQLLRSPPHGWEVVPVGASSRCKYHPIDWQATGQAQGGPITGRPGDVFLGLDFALDAVYQHRNQLRSFRQAGGTLWFMMHDLLPLDVPQWFSDKVVVRFRRWLGVLAGVADGFFCVSSPTETRLREELLTRFNVSRDDCASRVFPLGSDLSGSRPSRGLPADFELLLHAIRSRPTALMVGTLEPRKGHADVLAAFDILWDTGSEINLVIVGRPGWKTDELQARLRTHEHTGAKLFWLADTSDEALAHLYKSCTGVLVASHAEGFGLPVIEALGFGRHVLARALPVFEIHKSGVDYFPVDASPGDLADVIATWLLRIPNARPPATPPSWIDSAAAILEVLNGRQEPRACAHALLRPNFHDAQKTANAPECT
jgi:glycosyltransferase involved in cell wall biosynthesis